MAILTSILSKFAGPLLILVTGVIGGIGIQQKLLQPKKVQTFTCPDCNCPQPSVSIQPFEVEKIKNLKAFTYSPEFTGSIHVAGVDSTAIRKYLDEAVMKAFAQHVRTITVPIEETKKRRR